MLYSVMWKIETLASNLPDRLCEPYKASSCVNRIKPAPGKMYTNYHRYYGGY